MGRDHIVSATALRRRRLARFAAGIGLVLAGCLIAIAAMEIVARLLFTDGTNFDVEMWRYAKDLKTVSPLPGVGHEHVPNRSGTYMGVDIKINAHKLRDYDYDFTKPPGVVRILMLGDSITLGWGAPFDDITSKRLERRLNAGLATPRYQVINTGVGNYNTAMEVSYFFGEGYRYDPDVVVLNYFINDAEPTPIRKQNTLLEHSYAAVVAAGAFDTIERLYGGRPDWKAYYSGLYRDDEAGWRLAQRSLADIAAYCRVHRLPLLVANYPELHELAPYPFSAITAKLAAAAAANGLPFVDLLPAVAGVADPRTLWVTATDSHPNGLAAGLFAERLEAALRKDFPEQIRP
jgi:lysophospholipase L1-like esterase